MPSPSHPERFKGVLVVGAGPTGLTLAIDLARRGVPLRIIDRAPSPSIHSKALVVQPRTLEVFEDLGVIGEALARCQPVFRIEPRSEGAGIFRFEFPEGDEPYPRPVILRQSETERILEARLSALGVVVERGTELEELEVGEGGVRCRLSRGEEKEEVVCRFLAGCDGAHSTVRRALDMPFEGSTYPNDFLQADTHIDWDLDYDTGYGFLTDDGAMVVLPLGGRMVRVIRVRQQRPDDARDEPDLDEFQREMDRWGPPGTRLYDPEWCIRFRLHERLAARFRRGPVFLLGDAAHIHTPAGGQGMNTGIQDAHNLGWKLHWALSGLLDEGAGEALLDSYEAERRPIAQDVLRFTDFAFRFVLARAPRMRRLVALLAPRLVGDAVRRRVARRITQLDVDVRHGPLGVDARGPLARLARGPRVGDRAPDARLRRGDEPVRLFELLAGTEALVLVVASAEPEATRAAAARLEGGARGRARVVVVGADTGAPGVVAVEDTEGALARAYGAAEGEILVVRPDGYLGLRAPALDADAALAWLRAPGRPG